jgi:hypothetical protein
MSKKEKSDISSETAGKQVPATRNKPPREWMWPFFVMVLVALGADSGSDKSADLGRSG